MLTVWIALLGLFEAVLPEFSTRSLLKWIIMNLESKQRSYWRPPNSSPTQVDGARRLLLADLGCNQMQFSVGAEPPDLSC
eukprot:superscaffoldBa00008617_g23494